MSGKNATETLPADAAGIARAAQILRDGGLVAVPTETVYGLAARADSEAAVARIYRAKGRPSFNPLIVHVATLEQAEAIAEFSSAAMALADRYWPGPLTLVLPKRTNAALADDVTAGLNTIALRMPDHPVMRAVIEAVDAPLAAPSANRSGFVSPTAAEHVLASLDGLIDAVLDAGSCRAGLESTIVAVRENGSLILLREGPLGIEGVQQAVQGKIEAPGQMLSHYSPGKPVRLDVTQPYADEFWIGFGRWQGDANLSPGGDLIEAAANLYDCLHRASMAKQSSVAVAPVPDEGIGRAINDRLRRAAAPRDQRSGS